MSPSLEVTEATFESEVLRATQPVLVEFATGWSLPSMTLGGVLEEIAAESPDWLKIARVKLDQSPNLGLWYGIRCIPTILCFVEGEERIGIFGTTNKQAILSHLQSILKLNRRPVSDDYLPSGQASRSDRWGHNEYRRSSPNRQIIADGRSARSQPN